MSIVVPGVIGSAVQPSSRVARANRRGQRGAGRLKAILWILIAVSFIYACWLVVPVLFANYEFQDSLVETARFAEVNRQSADQMRNSVLKAAQDDGLPVTADDIQINHPGSHVQIIVTYNVTVDLHVYQWTLHFSPTADSM